MRVILIPTAQAVPAAPVAWSGPAVVIDALRATTTIVAALAAGALWVEPAATVAAARRRRRDLPDALLAGERHGDRLAGFDLGNSPIEVQGAAGRGIVLTTTNGTRAVDRLTRQGVLAPVFAAALPNRGAVARALTMAEGAADAVTVVCAGQDGHPAAEDLLVAGALVARLPAAWPRDDLATVAEWAWRAAGDAPDALVRRLGASPHGADLLRKGYAADVAACARLDDVDIVPTLVIAAGRRARFALSAP